MTHEIAEETVIAAAERAGYHEPRPAHFKLMRFPGLDGARPTDLVIRLNTSKQAVNALLNDLDQWGYIERRILKEDERGRVVRLTRRGLALATVIWEAHAELEARWESRVGHTRFHILRSTLSDLAQEHPGFAGRRP